MTLMELAIRANVSTSSLFLWEKGKLPTANKAVQLARVLDVRASELWPDVQLKRMNIIED